MDSPVKTEKIIARKDGAIGWVIFNNPEKRNAMSLEMYEATAAAMERYAKDSTIRVVILRGEGDKAFISGADISQFKDRRSNPEQVKAAEAISERCNAAIRDCHQALEINPYHFTAAAGMGQCYLLQDNPVAALEAFRRALRLNPGLEEVRTQVVRLQRSRKQD